MKYLIFSDTHLTKKFNQNLFKFLEGQILKSDQIIINGDFWDGFICTFDDFFKSKWSLLFPLLKEKHTIYIFGNHDRKEWSDQRIFKFCDVADLEYILKHNNIEYLVTHGNQYAPDIDEKLKIKRSKITAFLAEYGQFYLYKFLGRIMNKRNSLYNNIVLKYFLENFSNEQGLITGHTNYQYQSEDKRFINCGFNLYTNRQCVLLDDKDIIMIKH